MARRAAKLTGRQVRAIRARALTERRRTRWRASMVEMYGWAPTAKQIAAEAARLLTVYGR